MNILFQGMINSGKKVLKAFLLGFFGGVIMAVIALLIALGLDIVRQASSFSDIPAILVRIESYGNLAVDLLQNLAEELNFGSQIGYFLDAMLQRQATNPFSWSGFNALFFEALLIAVLTNVFSLLIAPQRGISSECYPTGFRFMRAIMHLVNSALAMSVVIVLQKLIPSAFWYILQFVIIVLAFGAEIIILYKRISIMKWTSILIHILKSDIIGYLLKQIMLCFFVNAIIHVMASGTATNMYEWSVCTVLIIVSIPFTSLVDQVFK